MRSDRAISPARAHGLRARPAPPPHTRCRDLEQRVDRAILHEFASTDLSDEELLQRRFHDRRLDQKGQAQLDPRWMSVDGLSSVGLNLSGVKTHATQSSDSISAAASECLRRQRSPARYRSHDPER